MDECSYDDLQWDACDTEPPYEPDVDEPPPTPEDEEEQSN